MRYVLAIVATLTLTGCGAMRQSRTDVAAPRTVLEVDNRSFSDMDIYLMNGGQRVRLGMATGNTKTKLIIPSTFVSGARQIQFVADPIGGTRASVSDQIYVDPGDEVTLIIPPG